MFIYIIKNKIAFYDDPEDYTAKKLYKKLLKEYGCKPVIIKLEPDENNEFAVTAEITPAQVLHLMAQTIYAQENKPVAYEITATGYDECSFGKKGEVPAPYIFDNEEESTDIFNKKAESEDVPDARNETITAYTDGSYNVKTGIAGYAAIIMAGDKEETLSGSITDPELTSMRNVAGELQAVLSVIEYAQQKGIKKAVICYDYEGIEKWYTGEWKAKKAFTQSYRNRLHLADMQIEFQKVKAHSGIDLNERVDKLAKYACGM